MSEVLIEQIQAAERAGNLRESSVQNIVAMLSGGQNALYRESVAELVAGGHWNELDDRFYTTLKFGTGGLRGRTIGKIVTRAEQGTPDPLGRPEFPCVGTNAMNFYNIRRATIGLCNYVKNWCASAAAGATPSGAGRPKIAIAYDSRHFSRDFAEVTAKTAAAHGCDVAVFREPRSTPELSFAARQLRCDSGVVITASHNPAHDNGFKAYFNDGAQIVEPHATAIIKEVNAIVSERYVPLPGDEQGEVTLLGEEFDAEYIELLKTLLLQPNLLEEDPIKDRFHEPPRHRRPHQCADAARPRLRGADRAGTGRAGRPFPDRRFPESRERACAENGHRTRRQGGRGNRDRHRSGCGSHGRGGARMRMAKWIC